MEEHGGGRYRHPRNPPPPDRFLGVSRPQPSFVSPQLELSEHDIFNTPSGSSSPSSVHSSSSPGRNPVRILPSHSRGHHGILAALNEQSPRSRSGSGSDSRPVFNHKASTSVSLSSSSSTSPAASVRSPAMTMIPKRPPPPPLPAGRTRFQPQSAPVNVPVMPASLARRARELEDVGSEEEEEEEENGGAMVLPPHEVVAARNTLMLSCSVLEGAGRTLKGRDLRQVRNAIWRRTGFLD